MVKKSSYIEYKSRGDRYENLSPEEYLNMIRLYLRDLINDHKPTMELPSKANNGDAKRGEWKIQLVIQNNCISSKDFEETCSIYSASKPIEVFMGSDTDDVIDKLFSTILQRFQQAIKTSNKRGSEFVHESVALLYYYFMKIDIKRAESYIKSLEWLVNEGAAINRKNEKDKCF